MNIVYRRSDFDSPRRLPVTRGLVVAAVLAFTLTHLAAAFVGGWLVEPEKIVITQTRYAPPPLTQWSCTEQERRELLHACANRLKSSATRLK